MASKANKYRDMAVEIVELVGGKDNIRSFAHCMTRLRMNLKDKGLVRGKELEKISGVMKVQWMNDQLQVVIGPQVSSVYPQVQEIVGDGAEDVGGVEDAAHGQKQGVVSRLLSVLNGIFVPVIPAIAGAGMLKAIIALLKTMGLVDVDSYTFQLFNMAADCVFYFLPFFLAVSSAKIFKTNTTLAVALAAALLHPTLLDLAKAGEVSSVSFFGLSSTTPTQSCPSCSASGS